MMNKKELKLLIRQKKANLDQLIKTGDAESGETMEAEVQSLQLELIKSYTQLGKIIVYRPRVYNMKPIPISRIGNPKLPDVDRVKGIEKSKKTPCKTEYCMVGHNTTFFVHCECGAYKNPYHTHNPPNGEIKYYGIKKMKEYER